jgi:hypothetical protein
MSKAQIAALDEQAHGRGSALFDALTPDAQVAVTERLAQWSKLAAHIHDERLKLDIRQTDQHLSAQLKSRVTQKQAQVIADFVNSGGVPNPAMDQAELELGHKILARPGARVVATEHPGGVKSFVVDMPPQRMQDHAFWMLDPKLKKEALTPGTRLNRAYIQELQGLSPGQVVDQTHVREHLLGINDFGSEYRGGPLQHTRVQDRMLIHEELRERNPAVWMRRYAEVAAERVAQAKVWGGSNEVANTLLKGMEGAQLHGAEFARKVFETSITGLPSTGPVQKAVTNAMMIKMLGFSTSILQFTQLGNSVMYNGIKDTVRGITKAMSDPVFRDEVRRSGAVFLDKPPIVDGMDMSKWSHFWVRKTGITAADAATRFITSAASVMKAEKAAELLHAELAAGRATLNANTGVLEFSTRAGKRASNLLRDVYGLSPEQLASQARGPQGHLTADQRAMAMQQGSKNMMFEVNVEDLPFNRIDPDKRWLYMFRTFGLQQGRLWDKAVMAPWKAGDKGLALQRTAAAMAAFGFAAVPSEMIRRELFRAPSKHQENILLSIGLSGMFGAMGDVAGNLAQGASQDRLASTLMGPVPTFVGNMAAKPLEAPIPNNLLNLYKNMTQ